MPGWGGATTQWEAAVTSADVLEQVEVYKYLGRMMAQDNNDTQALCAQLQMARATWAWVGQVLWNENTSLFVAAWFYQAVVQAILLYGSDTWVISQPAMAQLKGFHIQAAYQMAKMHKPWQGPRNEWVYPRSEDVLKECGMKTMAEYVQICRKMIAVYVATQPILQECRQGKQQRGAVPHHWWWEQPMDLDVPDAP